MDMTTIRRCLDDADAAAHWLRRLKVVNVKRGHDNLIAMAKSGVTLDLLGVIGGQLEEHLPACADPDMALNNLQRFVAAARNPLSVGTLFERDPATMPILLQIFATSQHFSDLLVYDTEGFDLLRLNEGQPIARQVLVDEIVAEVDALDPDQAVLRALRRFKRRETLRIAYGDLIREQSLEMVTGQISHLADALLEAALHAAWRAAEQKFGAPIAPGGDRARFVVLALGKLGGRELNYSSDVDLVYLYDGDGRTDGRRSTSNREFFEHVGREVIRLLTEPTELGAPYRVDLRLRPDGQRGPMVPNVEAALGYYDVRGRTWERQAYIKARPVAGDHALGRQFLEQLAPWIYRRYLSRADISGIKALKRRIEHHAHAEGNDGRNVKTGRGGIRDIEFVIQFLQLLNGGDLPELRTGNTLDAMVKLEVVGCLTNLERSILEKNYRFLRKVEHRLQIMFDLQTHVLPQDQAEMRKLALRAGYSGDREPLEAFQSDLRDRTELTRKILDHLLHDAFSDDAETEAEADLVLDPDPPAERVAEVLGKYPFRDVKRAYRNLMALSEEKIRFLSTRRCRHFLAAIAPRLLAAIAATPDPDSTLVNLDKVSDSLGGKGVLWELFSFNEPSLRLYVELCASSPFLCDILTSNPGMIDGLMDSLVLDRLPTRDLLEKLLAKLCRAAEDIDPILHSFKNDHELRVGVRDLLGKEDIQAATGALSDIAETCLARIAAVEHAKLAARFGHPEVGEGDRRGEPSELIVLAMGKLGGRELSYHSDLDLVFLYEAEGKTAAPHVRGAECTSNQHFFGELAQRIIKRTSQPGVYGRLYEIDARLRPTGRSGPLATSLAQFARYYSEGKGQLWERQALCRARVVYGSPRAAEAAESAVAEAAFAHAWRPAHAQEVRAMRRRLERGTTAGDLKRGPGGIVDVEFLVQMLQLKHADAIPALRTANTLDALQRLRAAGVLSAEDHESFQRSYRLLRLIESRLRLMNATARDQIPADPMERTRLAHLVNYATADELLDDYETASREIRRAFDRIFDAAAQ